MRTIADEKGVALITSLFFLVIVTALAAGALMLATVQVQVSGSVARWERAYAAAEACESYTFPLVTAIHYDGEVPPEYRSAITLDPAEEIAKKQIWSSGDVRNLICSAVDSFTVDVDIDSVGTVVIAGGSIESSSSYHKARMGSAEMAVYRITSRATTTGYASEMAGLCQAIYLKQP